MDEHPFAVAWRTRDLDTWVAALAPDVVLDSPLLRKPFCGRRDAADVFGALFASFTEFEITAHLSQAESHVFFWRGVIGSREVTGVDHLHGDANGQIDRITVYIRPLVGLGDFAAVLGPALARRRGRTRQWVSRVVTPPVRAIFAAIDAVASRLVGLH
ncbi:MAG: hypothetical protein QOG53_1864 [Frankiales bacterium]|nr:hypothetical protein [Frankiales bacterium]